MKFIFNKFLSIKESKTGLFFVSGLILILVVSFFFISNKNTDANVDRICVSYTPLGGSCVIPPGGWGAWSVVTPATPTTTGLIRRIGNGTKEHQLKKVFHARRMLCPTGSTELSAGNSGGDTGTYGGFVVVENMACQLIQEDVVNNTTQCVPPKVMSLGGMCILPTPPDQCYNIDGVQSTVPQGMSQDQTSYTCAPISADMCPNMSGLQISVPINKIVNAAGACVDMTAYVPTVAHTTIIDTCISNQTGNSGGIISVNKQMQWTVPIGGIPLGAIIDNTEWEGTGFPATVTNDGPYSNTLVKTYSTTGVKEIRGHVTAKAQNGMDIYSVACTGSVTVVVSPKITE